MQLTISVSTLLLIITIGAQARTQTVDDWSGSAEKRGHTASVIFVDSSSPGGDGSAGAPYQTIARAVQRAREIRAERRSRIIVRVAPGWYVEDFPIYLDLSNFELRGSTRLIKDDDGLPQNCGTDVIASPCVEPGTETVIAPAAPLTTGQVLMVIAPTRDTPADRVTDVTIRGFVLDGKTANVAASGTGIFIDRAEDFSVRGNVTRHVLVGILTRLASGTIRGHFAYDSNDGLAISGGSSIYPATVQVFGNRLTNNRLQGAIGLGAAGVRARINAPAIQPVQTVYDRIQHVAEVPDTLAIMLRHNDISRNGSFGIRLESYSGNNSFYDTVDAQPMTAVIRAIVHGNSFVNNGEYGLTVEGAFATRSNPRMFTARFEGSLEANDFAANGRAGLFVGFMLNGVVTRNPSLINTNKYLVDSGFTIVMADGLGDVDYDNPVLDPFDKTTPLNNVLMINGASIIGTHVTCPPGFPCVP